MKEIPLVKPEEAEFARKLERTFIELPKEAGILFASVSAHPSPKDPTDFFIIVGCELSMDVNTIYSLIIPIIEQVVPEASDYSLNIFRGISR